MIIYEWIKFWNYLDEFGFLTFWAEVYKNMAFSNGKILSFFFAKIGNLMWFYCQMINGILVSLVLLYF